jgi:hypothetical protein
LRPIRVHDLCRTFGTRTAGEGVALWTLQEWMGHRDLDATLIYADYRLDAHEAELVERAFGPSSARGDVADAPESATAAVSGVFEGRRVRASTRAGLAQGLATERSGQRVQ